MPPEFYREVPESWARRLKEIAPERPDLDHLVFRWFEPKEPNGDDRGWICHERGQWTLYTAKPVRLVETERAKMFERHWSELPKDEQSGREAMVSNYQHFMWHSQGLYVKPFLILQGEWGGTPSKYTEQEQAFLRGSECFDEPFPIGTFPACPFDERVVKQIAMRDRLLQCANRFEDLARRDTPGAMKSETEAAGLKFRETYLSTWAVVVQPQADFLKHWLQRSEHREELPPAPAVVKDNIGNWRDHFLEHNFIPGAVPAGQRQVR